MKSGSREAKGHKGTGGRRTWYEKRETLTSLSPPPLPRLGRAKQENGWAPSSHIMISSQVISRSADPLSLGDLSRG